MTDEEFHIFKGYYERLEHAGGKINVLNTNERLELAELLKKQMEINRKLSAFVQRERMLIVPFAYLSLELDTENGIKYLYASVDRHPDVCLLLLTLIHKGQKLLLSCQRTHDGIRLEL